MDRMVPIDELTAEVVRAAMKRAGATIDSVSEATGIAPTTLKRRLKGTSSFRLDEIYRIAKALGVEYHQLIPEASRARGAA
ncbi:helix-turn-helix domain-containing protein [Rhodococcus hoagii]|nr:helix-turn-helix domain-containing protein [Prescottella equi]